MNNAILNGKAVLKPITTPNQCFFRGNNPVSNGGNCNLTPSNPPFCTGDNFPSSCPLLDSIIVVSRVKTSPIEITVGETVACT